MEIKQQLEIIKRGAIEIISERELVHKLEESAKNKRPLVVKAGFDPTAPDIHLGHTVLLRKLKQFQDLGHKVVFLIGDFTGRIGDPSGRSEIRKQLTPEEVEKNAITYKKQISKILDMKKIQIAFNSKWFDKMQGLEFGQLLTHYTATRLLERDDFSQRMKDKKPLYMSELIYPILQGYDSVVLKADIELGGTDQKFNLLVGRDLQKDFKQEPQVVITMPLLEGTDGIQKMSKSYANYIGINEPAKDVFGKIMSISDTLMTKYYELLTDEDLPALKKMHPKEAKMQLAEIITTQYNSTEIAKDCRAEFQRVFTQKELPLDMPTYNLAAQGDSILDILVNSGLVKSKNEARRLIQQGGVSLDGVKIATEDALVNKSGVLKIGKKNFLKTEK